jgi:hypothetical protein
LESEGRGGCLQVRIERFGGTSQENAIELCIIASCLPSVCFQSLMVVTQLGKGAAYICEEM